MKLSHSKLSCILSCPATYYLQYIQGITKKEEKPALAIGSAVHWGIEHNTEDLSEYYGADHAWGRDEILSEAMVHGYLKHKNDIFDMILTASDGSKMTLVDENHELYITGKLKSNLIDHHDFVGIIDLLLLTDKGFVIIDYKTSTYVPDWNNYLDQIYRYIFLLKSTFPDVPIAKIGIINIRKTGIRQKKSENQSEFFNRMKFEYDVNDDQLINYHEFLPETLDKKVVDAYIDNMSKMADMAQVIDDRKIWYINFAAANGTYGKSDYWDIFYKTTDAQYLYKIRDTVYEKLDDGSYHKQDFRDCTALDMTVLTDSTVLNHYNDFKNIYKDIIAKDANILAEDFVKELKSKYHIDDDLLQQYIMNIKAEKSMKIF